MPRQAKTNLNIGEYDYFRTRVTIGHDINGKPIRKPFYGRTKGEAEAKKKEYIKAIESGINPDLGSQTLERSMYTWLWNIERHVGNKSSTFERYESIFRNYVQGSSIGHIVTMDFKKIAMQKYYNKLLESGKSYSVILNLNKLLKKFFIYAEQEGYISKNPIKGLKLPKDNEGDLDEDITKKVEVFSEDEIKRLLNLNYSYNF